jgi:hypothetical protein
LNKDGVIQPEELEQIGLSGLPNFEELGAEGHHYDVESGLLSHSRLLVSSLLKFTYRILSSP